MSIQILDEVFKIIEDRRDNPKPGSYTSRLMSEGLATICSKILEEASELVNACVAEDRPQIVLEAADLVFHVLVLLAYQWIPLEDVIREFERRRRARA